MTQSISGIAASNGIAIAKAFRLENPELIVNQQTVDSATDETERFDAAIAKACAELEIIKEKTAQQISDKEAAIFGAHLLVLSDPELIGPIKERIAADQVNAEFALQETTDMFIHMFEAMDNEYMKERAGHS